MKFFLTGAMAIAAVFAESCCCDKESPALHKTYVSTENVSLAGGILQVFCNGQWHNVQAIFSDEGGLFIYQSGYERGWYCNFCLRRHSCQLPCPYTGKEPPANCS